VKVGRACPYNISLRRQRLRVGRMFLYLAPARFGTKVNIGLGAALHPIVTASMARLVSVTDVRSCTLTGLQWQGCSTNRTPRHEPPYVRFRPEADVCCVAVTHPRLTLS